MHRILSLAVEPLRMIGLHPLPKGFLPKLGRGKARGWLYPDEDSKLLASPAVPLAWRVFYGFLNREGMRSIEAAQLTWADLDIERGIITLDENKTDDPRAWALSPGVVAALRAWRTMTSPRRIPQGDQRVFTVEVGTGGATRFRRHLRTAGVTRAALFERSAARMPIRLHDTRATFVTLALATGRSETWVMDRSGHRSSTMVNVYRRAARTAAELGLGDLAPLDAAIPELAAVTPKGGGKGGSGQDKEDEDRSTQDKQSGSAKLEGGQADILKVERQRLVPPRSVEFIADLESAPNDPQRLEPLDALSRPAAALSLTPRAALLGHLSVGLRAAVAAGDLEAARVAHEAIGKLLGPEAGELAAVVDLAERRKRGV